MRNFGANPMHVNFDFFLGEVVVEPNQLPQSKSILYNSIARINLLWKKKRCIYHDLLSSYSTCTMYIVRVVQVT